MDGIKEKEFPCKDCICISICRERCKCSLPISTLSKNCSIFYDYIKDENNHPCYDFKNVMQIYYFFNIEDCYRMTPIRLKL